MNTLLTEEERLLRSTVHGFAVRELAPRAAAYDESEAFPWDNVRGLGEMGLMGLTLSEQYGGAGASYAQLAIAIEEIAWGCAATSVIHLVHVSLAGDSIARFGSPELRSRLLPRMAIGELLGAFALTEPSSGSDAADMSTLAKRVEGGYLLNGVKTFITNGPEARMFVVFAATDKAKAARGVSAFVVHRDNPGLATNAQRGKLGMRASTTAEVVLTDCFVPDADRIGDEGDGFKIAMSVLDASRISVAAQAIGIGRAALDLALRHVRQRRTFGKPIADHQAVQFMIADMATRLDAARLLTRRAAQAKDAGLPYGRESAMAKVFASEAGSFACDRALQLFGGYGYFRESQVERLYRDVRVTEIYEGTSEVQRIVIARSILREAGDPPA
ncbi:MAG: acyl-CoA dehydrogenase [SAR202 cluster bacterium]|nr:acyl-CoA dehydrogenase [SAR202 cluster bacterium]